MGCTGKRMKVLEGFASQEEGAADNDDPSILCGPCLCACECLVKGFAIDGIPQSGNIHLAQGLAGGERARIAHGHGIGAGRKGRDPMQVGGNVLVPAEAGDEGKARC